MCELAFLTWILFLYTVITESLGGIAWFSPSMCADPQRSMNPTSCIQQIKIYAEDPNMFWFGSAWDRYCPSKHERFAECVDGRPLNQRQFLTLGSRIFQDNSFSSARYLSRLAYVPQVRYTSSSGSFSGCNTTENVPVSFSFDAYPGMPDVTPYFVKDAPQVTFPGCSTSQLCTVMFYDVGHGVLHNIWLNYPAQNNFSDYVGPGINVGTTNPYAWIYFFQPNTISDFRPSQTGPFEFNIPQFMQRYNLTGPMGITWLSVIADAYSLNFYETGIFGFSMQNCPVLLIRYMKLEGTYAQDLQLPTVPDFDMWMYIRYSDSRNGVFWVDTIRNRILARDAVVNSPTIYVQPRLASTTDIASDLSNQLFSLVLVEVVGSGMAGFGFGMPSSYVVRWFTVNSRSNAMTILSGDTVVPYALSDASSAVVTTLPRQFYFLLFRQNGSVQTQNVQQWLTGRGCAASTNFRCAFTLNDLGSIVTSSPYPAGLARFRIT